MCGSDPAGQAEQERRRRGHATNQGASVTLQLKVILAVFALVSVVNDDIRLASCPGGPGLTGRTTRKPMPTKVYLDYLMPRESFRFQDQRKADVGASATAGRGDLRLRDLADEWFKRLRKPDFQRETNAWTPETCRDLLQSVIRRDVIPGVILWKPEDPALIYVIDGAHRLSVIRAWMIDDWGDGQIDYFNAGYRNEIIAGSNEVRALVKETVGSYVDFIEAHSCLLKLSKEGKAPKQDMPNSQFERAIFYSAVTENIEMVTQWVEGNYAKAETSFLQINRSGERLSPFEQLLIEFRNGPYARVVSSIVSAGKAGHFWPEKDLDDVSATLVRKFPDLASATHNILFLPPHVGEVRNLNLPLVISKPGDRYEDCLDLAAMLFTLRFGWRR